MSRSTSTVEMCAKPKSSDGLHNAGSGGAMTGRGRVAGIETENVRTTMSAASPRYNTAPDRIGVRTPATPLNRVWVRHSLEVAVAQSVRQVRDSAVGLTAKDHDYLKAFSRGQYLTGVLRLIEIGQKCQEVAPATAFPEALRGFSVQHHPKAHVCAVEAFRAESYANGEFDAAQLAYAADPTEANRQWAVEAGNRQLAETYRSLNALHRGMRL